MNKLIITILFFIGLTSSMQAQHFDPMFNENSFRTWEDSGWYFMPHFIRLQIMSLENNGGMYSADIRFRSTDMSNLTFNGQATIFFREEDLPPGVEVAVGNRGFATVLFPEDLLFCPSPEEEQGMGQDDPYLPINLAGRLQRIEENIFENPVQVSVQLNDFTVN